MYLIDIFYFKNVCWRQMLMVVPEMDTTKRFGLSFALILLFAVCLLIGLRSCTTSTKLASGVTPTKLLAISPGMTTDTVRQFLGRPLSIENRSRYSPKADIKTGVLWLYSQPKFPAIASYYKVTLAFDLNERI
jgi:hypothetical protein